MEESKGTVSLWAKAHQSMWGRVKKQMDVAASVGDTMFKPVHGVVNLHSTGITAGGVKLRIPPAIFRLLTYVIPVIPVLVFSVMKNAYLTGALQTFFVKALHQFAIRKLLREGIPMDSFLLQAFTAIVVFNFMLILSLASASRGQSISMFCLGIHYRDQRTGEVCGFGTLLALYTIMSICSFFSAGVFFVIDFWAPFLTVQGQSLAEKIYGVVLCVKE